MQQAVSQMRSASSWKIESSSARQASTTWEEPQLIASTLERPDFLSYKSLATKAGQYDLGGATVETRSTMQTYQKEQMHLDASACLLCWQPCLFSAHDVVLGLCKKLRVHCGNLLLAACSCLCVCLALSPRFSLTQHFAAQNNQQQFQWEGMLKEVEIEGVKWIRAEPKKNAKTFTTTELEHFINQTLQP